MDSEKVKNRNLVLFGRLTKTLLFFSLFTMILGPLVRVEDAGLACPDWPLCMGKLIPGMDYKIFLEWMHRLVAGVTSLIALGWGGFSFANREIRKIFFLPTLAALLLLLLQIILGALTVTQLLDSHIVSLHLINSLLFIGVLIYCLSHSRRIETQVVYQKLNSGKPNLGKRNNPSSYLRVSFLFSFVLLLLVILQIFLGARVSSNNAGSVCNSFPSCYYKTSDNLSKKAIYFPPMIGAVEKHMTHRFGAYFLFLFTTVYTISVLSNKKKQHGHHERNSLLLILGLMCVQILLGIINVLYSIPVSVSVLHSFFAYLIYIFSLTLFLEKSFGFR